MGVNGQTLPISYQLHIDIFPLAYFCAVLCKLNEDHVQIFRWLTKGAGPIGSCKIVNNNIAKFKFEFLVNYKGFSFLDRFDQNFAIQNSNF